MTTETTSELCDRLDALHQAATPGPLREIVNPVGGKHLVIVGAPRDGVVDIVCALPPHNALSPANAAYIVEACNSVPDLVRRLRVAEMALREIWDAEPGDDVWGRARAALSEMEETP